MRHQGLTRDVRDIPSGTSHLRYPIWDIPNEIGLIGYSTRDILHGVPRSERLFREPEQDAAMPGVRQDDLSHRGLIIGNMKI